MHLLSNIVRHMRFRLRLFVGLVIWSSSDMLALTGLYISVSINLLSTKWPTASTFQYCTSWAFVNRWVFPNRCGFNHVFCDTQKDISCPRSCARDGSCPRQQSKTFKGFGVFMWNSFTIAASGNARVTGLFIRKISLKSSYVRFRSNAKI
jgi:hypothetical protein